MNSESSMRAVEPVLRDLILHIQKLESDNRALRDAVRQQSYQLARVEKEFQGLSFQKTLLSNRMEEAAKQIKAACRDEDDLSSKSVRRLWCALESLCE